MPKRGWFCTVCGKTWATYANQLGYGRHPSGKIKRVSIGGAMQHYAQTGHEVRMERAPGI